MGVNNSINVGWIGVGQCGTNLAATARSIFNRFEEPCKISGFNTCDGDNPSLIKDTYLLGTFGTGKNRQLALELFKLALSTDIDRKKLLMHIGERITSTPILFVPFSTGGGTGAALGPAISRMLSDPKIMVEMAELCGLEPVDRKTWLIGRSNSKEYDNAKVIVIDPIIVQIAVLPDNQEGKTAIQNSDQALKAISNSIEQVNGRAMLCINPSDISNRIGGTSKELSKYYEMINSSIVYQIRRYLNATNDEKYKSEGGANLDQADKMRYLSQSGIHAIGALRPITIFNKDFGGLPQIITGTFVDSMTHKHQDLINKYYTVEGSGSEREYRILNDFKFVNNSKEHNTLQQLFKYASIGEHGTLTDPIVSNQEIINYIIETPFLFNGATTCRTLVTEQQKASSSSRNKIAKAIGVEGDSVFQATFDNRGNQNSDMVAMFDLDILSSIFKVYHQRLTQVKEDERKRSTDTYNSNVEEEREAKIESFNLDDLV